MELGQYQLQIFVTLMVILGAAFVALICDLLKGNNEQLRELAIELKVRREEEQKRFQMLMPSMAKLGAAEKLGSAEKAGALENIGSAEKVARPAERQVEAPAEAQQVTETKKRVPVGVAANKEKRRAISADALAVMQRGAQMAAAPRPRRRAEQTESDRVQSVAEVHPPATHAAPEIEMVPASVPAAASIVSAPAHRHAANRDWSSLLSAHKSAAGGKTPGSGALLDAVVAATAFDASAQAAEPSLPSGFQDGFVLTRLVESRQPVSGLVVSIGASATQNVAGSLPSDVRMLIQSLIGPNDFAAQSGSEEFLLIFPGERGASAQRRLSQIAQQLWDFQLRSLGSFSILFSWGGVEVRSESIDEAIASATERMEETRRGRKILSMEANRESEVPLAQAV
jgi:hypothetical protein